MPDSDIKLLETAKDTARKAVEKEPSEANLKAFDKASKMLAVCLAGEAEPSFENRSEVLKYLKRLGYKISQGKLYQDVKNGLLKIESDGSVLESQVKSYISKIGLVKPHQVEYDIESTRMIRSKQEQELKMLSAKLEETTLKLDVMKKNLLDRNQVETEQAIKAGALMAGMNHAFRSIARDLIRLAGGNLEHTQAVINLLISKTEDLFDEFARMDEIEIEVGGR